MQQNNSQSCTDDNVLGSIEISCVTGGSAVCVELLRMSGRDFGKSKSASLQCIKNNMIVKRSGVTLIVFARPVSFLKACKLEPP